MRARGMVELSLEPVREIVVHERLKLPLKTLAREAARQGEPILWAEGVAFTYTALPWSEATVREALEGKLHWLWLYYAFTEHPGETLSVGGREVAVIDVGANLTLRRVATWIKAIERLPEYWEG